MLTVWEARAVIDARRRGRSAPQAADTSSLIALAAREGFEIDPSWQSEDNSP